MELGLANKRAVVTGSSAGIGRAIARTLAEEGALVVINGRGGRAETTAREIRAATRGTAIGVAADLATDEGAHLLAEMALSELGGVDILVNNAGVYFERGWWDTQPGAWAEIFNRNVSSSVRMIRRLGPRMRQAGWGRIINISSGLAFQPFAGMPDYAASKAAIANMTVSLAREFAGQG